MESRKAFMVSPFADCRHRKTAHFLIPSITSAKSAAVAAPSLDGASNFGDSPVNPSFIAWRRRAQNWKNWVDQMMSSHRSTWEKAGILDAILSSTFNIIRHHDLILGFLENWSSTTNTFAFPWGEATVTLEDTAVLGGYSVLGECVITPPDDGETETIVQKLLTARTVITRTKSRKADAGGWMANFMGSQNEIEHAAFLVYWLSRFVFPGGHNTVPKNVLPIAARLSTGTKIALAPAVLSTIYQSLSLWKKTVIAAQNNGDVDVVVSAPLLIVQAWIWERFPSLRPIPNSINPNNPRLAQWSDVKKLGISDLSAIISSAGREFEWRPYPRGKLYKQTGYWVKADSTTSNDDLEEFIRWIRPSNLVGLEPNCIEQYLPHRVAMQFGIDQDIPGRVARDSFDPHVAWTHYNRPTIDTSVHVPASHSLPLCTTRYLKWWKKVNQGRYKKLLEASIDDKSISVGLVCQMEETPTIRERTIRTKTEEVIVPKFEAEELPPPPGFSPKVRGDVLGNSGNCSKSSKRKQPDASSCRKISDYFGPVVTKSTVAKPRSVGSYNEDATSSCPEVEQSRERTEDMSGLVRLEERISNLEKLCAQLKSGRKVGLECDEKASCVMDRW